jgi:hypothetical protein
MPSSDADSTKQRIEPHRNECRESSRIKVSVPFEIKAEGGGFPIRGATADLSLNGCYIENLFPLAMGTNLDLQLSIGTTVLIAATVVTCDPQVGNGIKFINLLAEDREALKAFLAPLTEPPTSIQP